MITEEIIKKLDFHSQDFQDDPYPVYKEIRQCAPVFWSDDHQCYFAMGYDAVKTILNSKIFGVDIPFRASRQLFGRTIMDVDGEEHKRLRLIMSQAFHPNVVPGYADQLIKPVIQSVVDSIKHKTQVDFVSEFSTLIPIQIVAKIIGVPTDDLSFFQDKTEKITSFLDDTNKDSAFNLARNALKELEKYLIPILEANKKSAQDNVIGELVKAQNYGEKISDKEIIAQVCLLIPAAIDTTNRLIANTLFCLCSNQDQLIQVQNNHKLILNAIEETLRYEPPIHSTVRMALKDVDLMGVKIPSGSLINVNFASANRDGKYFQDSEKFDIFRKNTPHFSFGGGRHQCMGRALAIFEVQHTIDILLSQVNNIQFSKNQKNNISGISFRSPEKLILEFNK